MSKRKKEKQGREGECERKDKLQRLPLQNVGGERQRKAGDGRQSEIPLLNKRFYFLTLYCPLRICS